MAAAVAVFAVAVATGCGERPDPALLPDSLLRAELGLSDSDRVHRIVVTGGAMELVVPDSVAIREGDWVEFATADWRVHEVWFEIAELAAEGRAFLEESDQASSPPLVQEDARFVVSFRDAPVGRYPFRVEGNRAAARGVVVVVPSR